LELYYHNDLFRHCDAPGDRPEELELLPNFLFSCALAKHQLERVHGLEAVDYTLPSGKKVTSSDKMLQHAITMFPCLVMSLLTKIGVSSIPSKSGDDLLFHELFSETRDYEKYPLIHQLVTLYVNRSQASWKDPMVIRWLTKNITLVIDQYTAGDPMFANSKAVVMEHYEDSKTSSSTERHILLSDEEEALQTLPADVVRDGVRIYDDNGLPQHAPQDQPNPMLLFLQSLLPWFDPNARPEEQQHIMQHLAHQFQYDDED